MVTLWLFEHQLTENMQGFNLLDRKRDVILFVEAKSRATWQPYHKQKLVFMFSSMRHFAQRLRQQGYRVDYRKSESYNAGVNEHIADFDATQFILHLPTDWRMRQRLLRWANTQLTLGRKVTFLEEDALFLVKETEWATFLPKNKPWRMDTFYRKLRKQHQILMDGNEPVGGRWSFDHENRKPPKRSVQFIPPLAFEPDQITCDAIEDVEREFPEHFGRISNFGLPVTHEDAEAMLEQFLKFRLHTFGDYQDAMLIQDPVMSHSLLASAINVGLLDPMKVIRMAEQVYCDGLAPIAAVEGFIRQIMGWREYVRGVYLRSMPAYQQENALEHHRSLPAFYWSADTKMRCVKECVQTVIDTGYNHHIQRLMVLGNFANLAGIEPKQVADWFNLAYVDAHDWVVLPNVLGMALFADGGRMSTKPYVSTGNYIEKMSDYCQSCAYDIKEKTSEDACPFHALYWHFIDRHQEKLRANPRMSIILSQWSKQTAKTRDALLARAEQVLVLLDQNKL